MVKCLIKRGDEFTSTFFNHSKVISNRWDWYCLVDTRLAFYSALYFEATVTNVSPKNTTSFVAMFHLCLADMLGIFLPEQV
jgi:hypothetical protein